MGTAALLCVLGCCARQPANRQPALPMLTIEGKTVQVEMATTPGQRSHGLMGRTQLPLDNGMLFVYEHELIPAFWMKNTLIPLSAAFIDVQGKIVDIHDMQPQSLEQHSPTTKILYVLETNQGWFARNRITVGHSVKGLPAADQRGKGIER